MGRRLSDDDKLPMDTHMDLCSQAYDFNNYAGRRLAERIKDALDPNGILMPGKQGIWPKRLRGA